MVVGYPGKDGPGASYGMMHWIGKCNVSEPDAHGIRRTVERARPDGG